MKKKYLLSIIISLLLLGSACEEVFLQLRENLLRTGEIKEIGISDALVTGLLLDVGEDIDFQALEHGHCWSSTNPEPTIEVDTRSNFGETETFGEFSTRIDGLVPTTLYYVRPYVVDNLGVQYGETRSFRPGLVRNQLVEDIRRASNGGYVAFAQGTWEIEFIDEINTLGHCWAETTRPTLRDSRTAFNTNQTEGDFIFSNLDGLAPNTRYYVRSYCINTDGIVVYGEEITFETLD